MASSLDKKPNMKGTPVKPAMSKSTDKPRAYPTDSPNL